MIIKDQYGNEITVTDIILESENELLSISVTDGKIHFTLNDERILHSQLDELNEDDHKQYLDQVRHGQLDHSGLYTPGDIDDLGNVEIINPINEQVISYTNGIWRNYTSPSTRNHSLLDNLTQDGHPQYVHNSIPRTITAAHVYSTSGAPFTLTGASIGKLVAGLNSEFLSGYKAGDFALKDHTHILLEVPVHTHLGSDVTTAVQNSLMVGGKTVDQLAPLVHTHLGSQITSRVPDSSLLEGHASDYFAQANHTHAYAPDTQGVTGGNNHEHDGTITKKVNHNNLVNCGINSHADIDSHIQSRSNPHSVSKSQIGLGNVDDLKQIPLSLLTTKGDLVVGLGSGVARLPVGVDGAIPIADSTQAIGIRWTPFSTLFGGPYAAAVHTHSEYALMAHVHDYAASTHNHDTVYLKLAGGTLAGNLAMGGNQISGVKDPVINSDAATKGYVDARTFGAMFVGGAISIENTPPTATTGDRFIIGTSPTGAWILYPNYIAEKTVSGWNYTEPINGMVCNVGGDLYAYADGSWEVTNITFDHGNALGLTDDDHPQYALLSGPRTITGVWLFNTNFSIASNVLIENLNAEYLNGMSSGEFAQSIHTHAEADQSVLRYLGNDGNWDEPGARFAALVHNHDTLYFTKTQLQTSGAAQVHWNNITSKPTGYTPSIHRTTHQAGGTDEMDVSNLNGVLAQEQKAQSHDLLSKHTVSGLTPGYFLKALTTTTFGFTPHGLLYSDVGAAAAVHSHADYSLTTHNHNAVYAALIHTHDFALPDHNHDTLYAALNHIHSQYALSSHDHNTLYAPIGKGVTNGDSHDHAGGDGAQIAHANLSGIGTNSHTNIDGHITNANIHRALDDSSTTNTNLWSALKTQQAIQAGSAGAMVYKGTFEGSNPPETAQVGWYYKCIVDGGDYEAGQGIVWNGLGWDVIPNIDSVTSVDGRVGVITLSDVYAALVHTHTQAQSHGSPDTDTGVNSLHHTLGTGVNQAARGSHAAQHKSGGVDAILLSELGGTLTQAKTHDSPDTDASTTALHHTIGTGANQAAAGDHGHSTYSLTSHNHSGVYQPLDSDLTAIAGLTGTGFIKRTGDGTAVIDTTTYLTVITKAMVEAVLVGAITSHSHATAAHTHAQSDITNLATDLAAKAPLASPSLTGTPVAPTAAAGTNTAQIATTAFVIANSARATHSHSEYALTSHTHAIANITNLQTTLDGKAATGHTHTITQAIEFIVDGGGAVPSTGAKGCIEVPFACTVTGWKIIADVAGSMTAPINLYTYANYPTTVSSQISNTLSSAVKNSGAVSVAIAAGTILQFNISSISTVTKYTVSLTVTRTV